MKSSVRIFVIYHPEFSAVSGSVGTFYANPANAGSLNQQTTTTQNEAF
jgi:hypothetical protein